MKLLILCLFALFTSCVTSGFIVKKEHIPRHKGYYYYSYLNRDIPQEIPDKYFLIVNNVEDELCKIPVDKETYDRYIVGQYLDLYNLK
jgi:hypothetical protein